MIQPNKLTYDKVAVIKDTFDSYHIQMADRWRRQKELSITSLPDLDNLIWGFQRRKMVVFGARPSNGKSIALLQVGWDLAMAGKKVYFLTFEMTKEDCIERLYSNRCKIDNFSLLTGKAGQIEEISKHQEALHTFIQEMHTVDAKFVLIENFGRTYKEVVELIDTFSTPDVIIIDYVNMIRQDKHSKKESVDEYIKELYAMAKTKNFCLIMGAQINRETHKNKDGAIRPPEMWQLKDSGSVEEISDTVILTHWQWFYDREDLLIKNKYLMRVVKNRGGRTGDIEMMIFPEFYKLQCIPKADDFRVEKQINKDQ